MQSILYRSSLEAQARMAGWDPQKRRFGDWLGKAKIAPTTPEKDTTVQYDSAIASSDQSWERREELEREFEQLFLHGIHSKQVEVQKQRAEAALAENVAGALNSGSASAVASNSDSSTQSSAASTSTAMTHVATAASSKRPSVQMYVCIDDREGSLRRYAESMDPTVETFGIAGFFGLPIRYCSVTGADERVLAPEGQNPPAALVELEKNPGELDRYRFWQKFSGRLRLAWENASFSPFGSLVLSAFFPLSLGRLILMGYAPETKDKIIGWFRNRFMPKPETDFEIPFEPAEAAASLARTFKSIGTHTRFAPIVIVLGHGATSVNNPFSSAYNCGACGGAEGGPNARLFARLANDRSVRAVLRAEHGIDIPDDTVFVGGQHNTTAETMDFFDEDRIPSSHSARYAKALEIIDYARGQNALERCKRFMLASHVTTPEQALAHVYRRSVDPAEIRPELNHATNAAVVVGRRELTKGLKMDRRVFLPSYDPTYDDERGTNLESVLAPALVVCSGINLEYLFSTVSSNVHGAGTKTPLNVVGDIGVMQGTSGDLRPGLPSQMVEMHTPVRAFFLVDAPVSRIHAVFERRPELKQLVQNDWVRFFVRDPETGELFFSVSGECVPYHLDEKPPTMALADRGLLPRARGLSVAKHEEHVFYGINLAMLAACFGPIMYSGQMHLLDYGSYIVLGASTLTFPILAFSRRYLHGEFMFTRITALTVTLLLGFNMVATAPSIEVAMMGWSIFGYASTFLIGAYNERPSVRNNATFAFAAYKISDYALLAATAFSAEAAITGVHDRLPLAAGALLLAALYKSSQFPLTPLFVRSMEGPTPTSAIGYAGLSAHMGVIMLAATSYLWMPYELARFAIAGIGIYTALYSTLVAKIRADRKGALAHATAGTLGLIYTTLAAGYVDLALAMSLGHASFRMVQVLRSPNIIADHQSMRAALQQPISLKPVPEWLYRIAWRLRRVDTDFHLFNMLDWLSRPLHAIGSLKLPKTQQWGITAAGLVIAGLPFTGLTEMYEHHLMEMLLEKPWDALAVMIVHFTLSVLVIRFLFVLVLSSRRFVSPQGSDVKMKALQQAIAATSKSPAGQNAGSAATTARAATPIVDRSQKLDK